MVGIVEVVYLGLVEALGGLIIAAFASDFIQSVECDPQITDSAPRRGKDLSLSYGVILSA